MSKPTAVDLYCGAGGLMLGLRDAGWHVLLGVDRDPLAVQTSQAAGLPAVEASVQQLDAWAPQIPGEVVLLSGGPPCQPYSTSGHGRGGEDERDGLVDMVRAVDALGPRWVLVENVSAITSSTHRQHLHAALCTPLRARYRWTACWDLQAAHYGLPQWRRRRFIVAGPHPASPPTPTHGDTTDQLALLAARRPLVGWGTALAEQGQPHPYQVLIDRPAPTITTAPGQALGSAASRDLWERMSGARSITRAVAAALQGFPPGHPWTGPRSAVYRQIGNAVPPLLGCVVGRALLQADRRTP